jgi:hypothetical protein
MGHTCGCRIAQYLIGRKALGVFLLNNEERNLLVKDNLTVRKSMVAARQVETAVSNPSVCSVDLSVKVSLLVELRP